MDRVTAFLRARFFRKGGPRKTSCLPRPWGRIPGNAGSRAYLSASLLQVSRDVLASREGNATREKMSWETINCPFSAEMRMGHGRKAALVSGREHRRSANPFGTRRSAPPATTARSRDTSRPSARCPFRTAPAARIQVHRGSSPRRWHNANRGRDGP